MMEQSAGCEIKSIFVLKYAVVEFLPNYAVYWMGDPHYTPSQPPPTLFQYYWLIKTTERNILVDAGVSPEMALQRKMIDYKPPEILLGGVGLKTSDIDSIILTHAHWDHLDGIDSFPTGTLYVQRACYRFTVEEGAEHDFFRRWGYPTRKDSFSLLTLVWDNRLKILDGDAELFPGISVVKVDGHFPGLQLVVIETHDGRIVIASDAMHLYENLDRDFPMGLYFGNLREIVRGYERIRSLGGTVLPGHDPKVFDRFKPIGNDVVQVYP